MPLFGNKAKRLAKKRSVQDWMLWNYKVRVESAEAALAVGSAQRQGVHPHDLAMQLHKTCWHGAGGEAARYYEEARVRAVFEDGKLENEAAQTLVYCQVNRTAVPFLTDEVMQSVEEMIALSHDPNRKREIEIKDLQSR